MQGVSKRFPYVARAFSCADFCSFTFKICSAAVVSIFCLFIVEAGAQTFPGASWDTRTPQQLGMDTTKVDQFAANLGGVGCIIKDGYLIKSWGSPSSKGDWASAAKPVITTMLFFAIEEGLLTNVDAPVNPVVRSLYNTDLSSKDRTMTFRHLANMTSGYARGEVPGSHWSYNDTAISLYRRTLFDGVFGTSANQAALHSNRLGALQFQDGSIFSSRGGSGVSTSPRDFARIGWLWLNRGEWNGQQLLPRSYFDSYMKPDVAGNLPRSAINGSDYLSVGSFGGGSNQTQYGPGIYGFNWWFNTTVGTSSTRTWPDAPADTLQANGHWNKEVMTIIPSLGLVVAARGSWGSFTPGTAGGMNQNLKLLVDAVSDGPVAGQIMVDPNNPAWFVYNKDDNSDGKLDPHFLAGAGDPENFLYRGTRNADGTRSGDQLAIINRLAGTNANSVYLQAVRSHGGDGSSDHNPFVDSDPMKGLDDDILSQWESWFSEMDRKGIVVFFFLYDDSARIWNTGDAVGSEERSLIQGLVSRFKHHRHIVWVIAEEYQERYSVARVSSIAAEIRAADNHTHPIAVHQLNGLTFHFPDDPNIDQFAIQYNNQDATGLHGGMITAWNSAAERFNLNMSESAGHYVSDARAVRLKNWSTAMGGAYVMLFQADVINTPIGHLQDLGRLRQFMETTNFNEMAPHDELAFGGTQYILAQPGSSYIAYASNLSGSVGIKNMTAGTYDIRWFDTTNGTTVVQSSVALVAGDRSFSKPASIGAELAVHIHRSDGTNPPDTVAPSAPGSLRLQ